MNPQSSSKQVLNWTREESIVVPSSDYEVRMGIRHSDWTRIKRRLSQCVDKGTRLSVIYSILFGTTATSGFSIIPIAKSQGLPSWVTPFYVCVCAFSLLCGCVFVWVDRKVYSRRKSEIQEIEEDMKNIEATFEIERAELIEDETT